MLPHLLLGLSLKLGAGVHKLAYLPRHLLQAAPQQLH